MTANEIGVIIEGGIQDWQIVQQRGDGAADIRLHGRWTTPTIHRTAAVIVRLVLEDEYRAVNRRLDWQTAATGSDGRWTITLPNVPAGGLYRIETGLALDGLAPEYAERGDIRHHVGVGDVWIIAGQSNAVGVGRWPVQDPPELGLHMFRANGTWALATHPLADATGSRYPASCEMHNTSHSPFLAFARVLKKRLGYPVGLIPAALGGSPIAAWLKSMDGKLFDNMVACVSDAGGAVRGMCWYQGCNDTLTPQRDSYLACFREYTLDVRRTLDHPALPILTVQINRVINHPAGAPTNAAWDQIREAQRQAARTIPGVTVIPSLDCGLSDCIHNNSSANLVIGERLAAMALGQVYGRDEKCLHPDLERVTRADARTLDLLFRNVDGGLSFEVVDPAALPFRVTDAVGVVPLTGLKITAADTVRLELGRELQGAVTVVGAPGTNPPLFVPFDVCGYRPMLAFTVSVP